MQVLRLAVQLDVEFVEIDLEVSYLNSGVWISLCACQLIGAQSHRPLARGANLKRSNVPYGLAQPSICGQIYDYGPVCLFLVTTRVEIA